MDRWSVILTWTSSSADQSLPKWRFGKPWHERSIILVLVSIDYQAKCPEIANSFLSDWLNSPSAYVRVFSRSGDRESYQYSQVRIEFNRLNFDRGTDYWRTFYGLSSKATFRHRIWGKCSKRCQVLLLPTSMSPYFMFSVTENSLFGPSVRLAHWSVINSVQFIIKLNFPMGPTQSLITRNLRSF